MRYALAASVAALGLAACGDSQTARFKPDAYSPQEARRDAQQLPPTTMPNPDERPPAVPTVPRSTDPLDPTDPLAQPPGSPPPPLPPTPPG
ncbi:MAG: hypothetical protein QM773_20405 [Hyphomonadaceae bacterium]